MSIMALVSLSGIWGSSPTGPVGQRARGESGDGIPENDLGSPRFQGLGESGSQSTCSLLECWVLGPGDFLKEGVFSLCPCWSDPD